MKFGFNFDANVSAATKVVAGNQNTTKKKLKNLLPNIQTLLQDSSSTYSQFLPSPVETSCENELSAVSSDGAISTSENIATAKTSCIPRIYTKLSSVSKDIAGSQSSALARSSSYGLPGNLNGFRVEHLEMLPDAVNRVLTSLIFPLIAKPLILEKLSF